jgi:hypothetical protein
MSTPKTPRNVISVRFSDEEIAQVKAQSERTGEPVSTVIRNAALHRPAVGGTIVNSSVNRGAAPALTAQVTGGQVTTAPNGTMSLSTSMV